MEQPVLSVQIDCLNVKTHNNFSFEKLHNLVKIHVEKNLSDMFEFLVIAQKNHSSWYC